MEKTGLVCSRNFSSRVNTCRIVRLLVTHVNVCAKDDGAGGDHRRSVVQENWVVHGKLAYLIGHVHHETTFVEAEHVQITINRCNRPGELQVKAKLDQNFCLEVVDGLLVDLLLLIVGEKFECKLNIGSIFLVHFCGQDDRCGCEEAKLHAWEIPVPNTDQIPVHDVHRCEKCLAAVLLLGVEAEYLLHGIGTVILR